VVHDPRTDVAYLTLNLVVKVVHGPRSEIDGSWDVLDVSVLGSSYPYKEVDITGCMSEDDWDELDYKLSEWHATPIGELNV